MMCLWQNDVYHDGCGRRSAWSLLLPHDVCSVFVGSSPGREYCGGVRSLSFVFSSFFVLLLIVLSCLGE